MEWLSDLEAICSSLGTWDGANYIKDDDCQEGVKDLIRLLRRDDDNHTIRRSLGQIEVVQSDLIPLIRDAAARHDPDLFQLALRLLVNLTNPEILLFREELPEDKVTRKYYLELQGHRRKYKAAFADPGLWEGLSAKMAEILAKDWAERTEDEQETVERILILTRNVLQVSPKSGVVSGFEISVMK